MNMNINLMRYFYYLYRKAGKLASPTVAVEAVKAAEIIEAVSVVDVEQRLVYLGSITH